MENQNAVCIQIMPCNGFQQIKRYACSKTG